MPGGPHTGRRRGVGRDGHEVVVERDAGSRVGLTDAQYATVGASLADANGVWGCDCLVKVKEVQPGEYGRLRRGMTILGFAQLNRDPALLAAVLRAGTRIIACETVRAGDGALPLLAPMSRIAGRLAPLVAAQCLWTERGGAGVLLPGVDAVSPAAVVVIGAGEVGREAARVAARIGCRVRVFSRGRRRLCQLVQALQDEGLAVGAFTLDDAHERFAEAVAAADVLIAGVLEPGRLSPTLITRAMLRSMRPGSALVDVGIDQGGVAETSRVTRLSAPTYVEEGVVHYGVPNMPALVARTATLAFTDATLPYVRALAGRGIVQALAADAGLAAGLMTWDGDVVHQGLAHDSGREARPMPRG